MSKKTDGKKVSITLKSISAANGIPDVTELVTSGYLQTVDENGESGYCVSYEDSAATGFQGTETKVSCFGERLARMERVGAGNSDKITELMMESQKKHHCFYGTEYGDLMLGIYTKQIVNRMTDDGGQLYLKYTLDVNSALLTENEVYMEVKPV